MRKNEEGLSETEFIYRLEGDVEAVHRGELKTRPLHDLWDELGIEPSEDNEAID